MLTSALKYQTHAPIVKELIGSLGLSLDNVAGLTAPLNEIINPITPLNEVVAPLKDTVIEDLSI